MNPKLVISNYFDSLINQIDIHTEEELSNTKETDLILTDKPFTFQLEPGANNEFDFNFWKIGEGNWKDDEKQTIEYPLSTQYKYDFSHQKSRHIPSGSIKVSDFLNETRDKLIERVKEVQVDAFKRYEEIKEHLKFSQDDTKTQEEQEEEIKRKLFANKFLGLIRVDQIVNFDGEKYTKSNNESPFKLYLVELDFYMDQGEQLYFWYFLLKYT